MKTNDPFAVKMAIELVASALQSKSISLLGPKESDTEKATICATADSAYLALLINSLTETIQTLSN